LKNLYEFLKERLREARKIAILGVGSVLRADDAAGILVVEKLAKAIDTKEYPNVRFYDGQTAPENFCGVIRQFCPSHLIIIDAADVSKKPGSILHLDPEDIGGISFCTHMLPLKMMVEYLQRQTHTAATILGIQYKDVSFDSFMTSEVREAVDEISEIMERVIKETVPYEHA
jgi:hydrogenase 3 maturation protease